MAKLSPPPRILADSYKAQDIPDWFESVFGIVNKGFEDIFRVCNGALVVPDNIKAQYISFVLSTPADYATGGFSPVTLAVTIERPVGVRVISVNQDSANLVVGTSPVGLPVGGWSLLNNSTIRINYIGGLLASTRYSITVRVE